MAYGRWRTKYDGGIGAAGVASCRMMHTLFIGYHCSSADRCGGTNVVGCVMSHLSLGCGKNGLCNGLCSGVKAFFWTDVPHGRWGADTIDSSRLGGRGGGGAISLLRSGRVSYRRVRRDQMERL